jgi:predicted enzyme related to lactoylglutathione lyase
MPEVTGHSPGSFCWMELGTSDSEAAKKFYSSLFGWETMDIPTGPGQVYTMLQIGGKDVSALYQLTEQYHKGVPTHWLSYIAVTSADETAAKAKQLGATVTMEPFDVMDVGRMAMIQDPQGAMFAIWQAKSHIGVRLAGEPNTLCWNELATTDTDAGGQFYSKLFGWTFKSGDAGPMIYHEISNAGTQIGGMYKITEEMKGMPPNWMAYYAVTNCDATADRAKSMGAALVVPPTDIPNVGRFCTIKDPQGGVFAVIQLNNM